VRVLENIHNKLRIGAGAVSIDIVGELVVDEKEYHKVTGNPEAV